MMYSSMNQNVDTKSLWIGDLDPYMDDEAVRNMFPYEVHPHIANVKVIKKDGRPAGYGFIEFTSSEAAQSILTNYSGRQVYSLPGKFYRLNWASTTSNPSAQSGGMQSMGGGSGGGGGAYSAYSHAYGGGRQMGGSGSAGEFSVFVGDLAPDVTDYVLLTAFQQRYPSVKGAKVIMDPNTNQTKGFGFVKFTDEYDMMRAMEEMPGQYISSRPIKVAPAANSKKSSHSSGGPSLSHSPVSGMSASSGGGGGGSGNINDPGNTTIYVGNIDPNTCDENVLRSSFQIYGPIVYVKIPSHNRHCGFVQFMHRQDAERAVVEMNGTRIQGNVVRVSWGRSQKRQSSPTPMLGSSQLGGASSSQAYQSQQQQYYAYLQWQQMMTAYSQQMQTMQQSTQQQTSSTANSDQLPVDYFTRPIDQYITEENKRFCQDDFFTFNSISFSTGSSTEHRYD